LYKPCLRRLFLPPELFLNGCKFRLVIDRRERQSRLSELAIASGIFDVEIKTLGSGDFIVENSILIERKSGADFLASIVDGRLFQQAAIMVRHPLRALFLLEGPDDFGAGGFHPHARLGACISLAATWGLPLISSRNPEESLVALRLLAEQAQAPARLQLHRPGYRPKRIHSRKSFILQGLPGVGPALAESLLKHFGSLQKVMSADSAQLRQVRGCGPKKSDAIQHILTSED
jgi:DNA excision repair protein ERCC-4